MIKKINFVWIQGEDHLRKTRPDLFRMVQSWQPLFPGWTVRVWCDKDILDLLTSMSSRYADTYNHVTKPAMKADIARLGILFMEGGMYVDTDMECLRSFEHFLSPDKPSLLLAHEQNWVERRMTRMLVNNDWLYTPVKHFEGFRAILDSGCKAFEDANRSHSMNTVLNTFGPAALRRVLYDDAQTRNQIAWLPSSLIDPLTFINFHLKSKIKTREDALELFPYAYALHHADWSWLSLPKSVLSAVGIVHGEVRENYIVVIGVFAALIVALIIAVIVLSIQKSKLQGAVENILS